MVFLLVNITAAEVKVGLIASTALIVIGAVVVETQLPLVTLTVYAPELAAL